MDSNMLLWHIAQVQAADSKVIHQIADGVTKLLAASQIQVPPELAEAIGESKIKHDALKAALDAAAHEQN